MLIWVAIFTQLARAEINPVTLNQAYEAALTRTETMPIQDQRTLQTQERLNQGKGGILPHLSLLGSYTRQDSSALGTTTSTTSSSADPNQTAARLTLTQPIFHGFREFSGIRVLSANLRAQSENAKQAQIILFTSVSQAFYSVISAEKDLIDLRNLSDLTQKRVQELQSRVKIGRSRKAELLAAEAQAALLQSQMEQATAQIDQARQQFALTTGLDANTQLKDTTDPIPTSLPTLDSFLSQISQRPDLASLQALVDAAEENVEYAKGGHFPGFDLGANYYLRRTGILASNKWDITLSATLPLYEGGITQSQVREAAAKREEQQLVLAQARRTALQEVQTAYVSTASSLKQLEALRLTLKISESAFQEQSRDYRYGMATNLDVLQALNSFQEARRNLDRTEYQARMQFITLNASVGTSPAHSSTSGPSSGAHK